MGGGGPRGVPGAERVRGVELVEVGGLEGLLGLSNSMARREYRA